MLRTRKAGPKSFRLKCLCGCPRSMSVPKMLVFPRFGGPHQCFWQIVRRDVHLKTSSLGTLFVSDFFQVRIKHAKNFRKKYWGP